jgi:DNA-binding MarR family transcriptional regulator
MLLDLYANQIEGQPISVSSACLAGAVPSTTALGWLAKLEKRKLVLRTRDPKDGRRTFMTLSDRAVTSMENWLASAFGQTKHS